MTCSAKERRRKRTLADVYFFAVAGCQANFSQCGQAGRQAGRQQQIYRQCLNVLTRRQTVSLCVCFGGSSAPAKYGYQKMVKAKEMGRVHRQRCFPTLTFIKCLVEEMLAIPV